MQRSIQCVFGDQICKVNCLSINPYLEFERRYLVYDPPADLKSVEWLSKTSCSCTVLLRYKQCVPVRFELAGDDPCSIRWLRREQSCNISASCKSWTCNSVCGHPVDEWADTKPMHWCGSYILGRRWWCDHQMIDGNPASHRVPVT